MDHASPKNLLDNPNEKPSFRKHMQDIANRKYRRHSPVGGSDSSSSGGSPKHRSRSPVHSDNRHRKDDKKDSLRHSEKHLHVTYHDYARYEDYSRNHGHPENDDRNYHRSSRTNSDKYSRDKYSRDSKDYRHADRDRNKVRDVRDERKDNHRSSNDNRNEHRYSREESRVSKDSTFERLRGDKEGDRRKEKIIKEPEAEVKPKESQEQSALKKLKNYDYEDEKPSLSLKEAKGKFEKITNEPLVNQSETTQDLNAAKFAALKAAELVNKNLGGTSYMSTDQKKKLLWGNKKDTSTELKQSGNLWGQQLFEDRERQEKFNKLMGVKGDAEHKPAEMDAEMKQKLEMDLEKQYTAGLRRRDGRTVGLGL